MMTPHETLRKQVEQIVSFSETEWEQVKSCFHFRKVAKKTVLIHQEETAQELFFIIKGLLRLYYIKDGAPITAFLFTENLFAGSHESFITQQPGLQNLDALEKSELLVISYEDMQWLYQEVPKMNMLTRVVAEQRFVNGQQLFASYLLDSPEERYKKFSKRFPRLEQRVPQHMIASFLGITPISLSRIRKRIAEEELGKARKN